MEAMASVLTGSGRAPQRGIERSPGLTPAAPGTSNPGMGDPGRSSFNSISFYLYYSVYKKSWPGVWEGPGCWELSSVPP